MLVEREGDVEGRRLVLVQDIVAELLRPLLVVERLIAIAERPRDQLSQPRSLRELLWGPPWPGPVGPPLSRRQAPRTHGAVH